LELQVGHEAIRNYEQRVNLNGYVEQLVTSGVEDSRAQPVVWSVSGFAVKTVLARPFIEVPLFGHNKSSRKEHKRTGVKK